MLYTSQKVEVYTLIIYVIHGKCANTMLSHHLRLKVQCNFTYVIKGFENFDCNYFLVTNYSCKLVFFTSVTH